MGGFFSYMMSFVTPMDSTPDPVTGLSERDRQAITDTWTLVADKKSIKENGVQLFMVLFKTHPYMQDYFESFRGRSLKELEKCPKLRAHATSVMYAIQSYVGTLDDAETLAGLVTKIASSHVKRGITSEDLERLFVVILEFLEAGLQSKWTPEAAAAWKQLLKVHTVLYRQVEEQLKGEK